MHVRISPFLEETLQYQGDLIRQIWRATKEEMQYSITTKCAMLQVRNTMSILLKDLSHLNFRVDPGIIALLPDRPPQVTFSCNKIDGTCLFQFWVNRVESFYCGLESCKSKVVQEPGSNKTVYECEDIQCSCIPGRFICGENGSVGKSGTLLLVYGVFSLY